MVSILILLVGVAVVIGGVLVLRLHAFLALILGALAVSLLTPSRNVEKYLLDKEGWKVAAVNDAPGQYLLQLDADLPPDTPLVFFREPKNANAARMERLDSGVVKNPQARPQASREFRRGSRTPSCSRATMSCASRLRPPRRSWSR